MNKAIDIVLDEFTKLSQIPRPTHHEERIAAYLKHWAEARGLQTERDELGELIIEKPASPGCENAPRVILQAHMDMLCMAEEGVKYDPVNDPIRVLNNGKTITAEGTTLGADDGIGIAMAMYILQADSLRHGPIRVVFTTGEETTMDARHINPKYLTGTYLINLDWKASDSICNSCAGSVVCNMSRRADWEAAPADTRTMSVGFSDLLGGHSGVDINSGHANAVTGLAMAMVKLRHSGVSFRIASFNGGQAVNSIPNHAKVVFAIAEDELDRAKAVLDTYAADFREAYSSVETKYSFEVSVDDAPPACVLNRDTGYRLVDLITMIPDGVRSMVPGSARLVESSATVGQVSVDEKYIRISDLVRSSANYQEKRMEAICESAAQRCHFDFASNSHIPPWVMNPESRLAKIACDEYQKITGKTMQVDLAHAGMVCGVFAKKNPMLDMISMGPTMHNPHTPDESCEIEDIRVTLETLLGIIQSVAK